MNITNHALERYNERFRQSYTKQQLNNSIMCANRERINADIIIITKGNAMFIVKEHTVITSLYVRNMYDKQRLINKYVK